VDIWQSNQKIIFNDVDPSGGITPFAVFNYFQDAAESHAERIGVGRERMLNHRQMWVLSRMSVLIDKRAKLGEDIVLRSWPRGYDRLFCVRDYDIADTNGNFITRARSGWLVVDWEKRRPLRPQSLEFDIPVNEGLDALPGSPLGLETRNSLVKISERRAAYSDIDFNGHMNNARYVQWIQDSVDGAALQNAKQLRLDINYLNETHLNDVVDIRAAPIIDDDSARFAGAAQKIALEGRKNNDGGAVFRAELYIL
jgi:acyl-ACP thioesterase